MQWSGATIIAAAAFAAGMAASATFYERVTIPGREATVTERVTRDVEVRIATASRAAAAEAVAGELARRQAAIDKANAAYAEAVAIDAAKFGENRRIMAERDKRYAETLASKGKSCPLDLDTDLYLDGLQDAERP